MGKNIPVTLSKRLTAGTIMAGAVISWHFARVPRTPRFLLLTFRSFNRTPPYDRNESKFFLFDDNDEIQSIPALLNQTPCPIDRIEINKKEIYILKVTIFM